MNKLAKILTCAVLSSAMLFTVACHPKDNPVEEDPVVDETPTQQYDTETRALTLSISPIDGVFNPYFYTSLTDGKVISMTQASLITSDEINGEVEAVAGDQYPTIAKDYEIKYYDSKTGGNECDSSVAAVNGRTEYSFLIKKDMKFSDGTDVTIKDVLFNFYVYLDTAYTGSNTMYSVDIQGLTAYRENDSTKQDGDTGAEASANANAQNRIQNLVDYGSGELDALDDQGNADYNRVKELFTEELNTDWNNATSNWVEAFKDYYHFDSEWKAYLYQEGIIRKQQRQYSDGSIRDIKVNDSGEEINPTVAGNEDAYKNGKFLTTNDPWREGAYGGDNGKIAIQDVVDGIEALGGNSEAIKDYCINDVVYNRYLGDKSGLVEVLLGWQTGTNARNEFYADEYGKLTSVSQSPQYYITGIRPEKTNTFKGQDLGGTYDVLKVVVNRVDPAAIWQFGISIAPVSYYSGVYNGKDYRVVNGDDTSLYAQNNGRGSEDLCFGVCRGEFQGFFQGVLRDSVKSGVPKGAGPYKASTENGGDATNKGDFFKNYIVNYERNPYFDTLGTFENAHIKTLRYKVVDESRIISSVETGDIDYGEPNATSTNLTAVEEKSDKIGRTHYLTNGYGYVGVNPKKVPNMTVRDVIMRAMDTGLSIKYYGELGELIYRPMSKTSWAYPKGAVNAIAQWTNANDIKEILRKAGCTDPEPGNTKPHAWNDPLGKPMKYTFTIAGANSDHPAYNMFINAANRLNTAGFEISVSTDANALLKLTSGDLEVWAAAWSSGVDPDMYQVYHKDSKASSTLNWGYDVIKDVNNHDYDAERDIVNNLSDKIMEARKTLDKSVRKGLYSQCLDMIMTLRCELPVYQRRDLCVYNKTVIDPASLNQNPNATIGLIDRIWEVNYL